MKSIFKRGLITGVFVVLYSTTHAQIEPDATGFYIDALRYSQLQPGGSARFMALGGAVTALGANMGTMANNPAGMGQYRKPESSITPGIGFNTAKTNYIDEELKDGKINLYINNLGFVSSMIDDEKEGWKGGNWGFSFNRTNSFQSQFSYDATNSLNNIGDFFTDITTGIPVSVLSNEIDPNNNALSLEGLAYYAFLTNEDTLAGPDPTTYFTFYEGESVRQQEIVNRKGSQSSWDLSYGANYNNRLFLGVSVAFQSLRYIEEVVFSEELVSSSSPDFQSMELEEEYKSSGLGFNGKLGFIYRASDAFRFGASFHSPTYYRVTDRYTATMTTNYNFFEYPTASGNILEEVSLSTAPFNFTWRLTTPLRINTGFALFAGKSGFISADVEYVPYNTAKITDPEDFTTFSGDNKTIKNLYRPVANIKLGGELRFEHIKLRGGVAFYDDPYRKDVDDVNRSRLFYSAGIGLELDNNFLDITAVYSREQLSYTPYTSTNVVSPTATIKNNFTNFVFTFGSYF